MSLGKAPNADWKSWILGLTRVPRAASWMHAVGILLGGRRVPGLRSGLASSHTLNTAGRRPWRPSRAGERTLGGVVVVL